MKSGLMGAGIGGSAATHSRHSHPGNYVSRDDANTVIGDRPTLRSGSFPKGEGRSVEIPQKDKGGPQVPCSSSSAVLLRKLPQRCSTAYMETACRSTRPLWPRRQMYGSVSALRVYYLADLRLAAWARCFGPPVWFCDHRFSGQTQAGE